MSVPVAPDKPVHGNQPGNIAQPGKKRYGQEEDGGRTGEVDGDEVDVGRVVEAGHLVPEGVQPQPGLARIAPGFVHDAPLGAREVLGRGHIAEVLAVLQE